VDRRGRLVVAEGGSQVRIIGEILRRVERIACPAFRESMLDEMLRAGVLARPQSADEVPIGSYILQAAEAVPGAVLVEAGDDEMLGRGVLSAVGHARREHLVLRRAAQRAADRAGLPPRLHP